MKNLVLRNLMQMIGKTEPEASCARGKLLIIIACATLSVLTLNLALQFVFEALALYMEQLGYTSLVIALSKGFISLTMFAILITACFHRVQSEDIRYESSNAQLYALAGSCLNGFLKGYKQYNK